MHPDHAEHAGRALAATVSPFTAHATVSPAPARTLAEAHWVSPSATLIAALIFGLLIGSFLNVVIHRLPRMMQARWAQEAAELQAEQQARAAEVGEPGPPAHGSTPAAAASVAPAAAAAPYNLMVPRSACPHCGHVLGARENIPLVSWLLQRGRCTACAAPISVRYPVVEATTALLVAACIGLLGLTPTGLAAAALCCTLVALAGIDLDTMLLPDSLTLPLLWGGLLLTASGHGFTDLSSAVWGAAAGYLALWSIYWIFRLLTGREGMGYGDFKLLAALGAWFGWQALPGIILLSSAVGAVTGIALIVFARHGRQVPIPFGPYLAGAGLLALFAGQPLQALFGL